MDDYGKVLQHDGMWAIVSPQGNILIGTIWPIRRQSKDARYSISKGLPVDHLNVHGHRRKNAVRNYWRRCHRAGERFVKVDVSLKEGE